MPPRAIRRPSTAPALKKKTPPKAGAAAAAPEQDQVKEPRASLPLPSLNDPPLDHSPSRSPSPSGREEYDAPKVHEMDRSERLDISDHDLQSEPEDNAAGASFYENDEHDGNGRDEDGGEEYEDDVIEIEEGEGDEEEEEGNGEGAHDAADEEYEEEHHEVMKERRKHKEFEIFVGGLDRDATEGDLRNVFGEVGEVTEVRLMRNPVTHKNKGFAFLRFATIEQARHAINELKHSMVNGKQCGVAPSQDSDTLFVGNICRTWTKEMLKEKLVEYGVDNFEDLTLVEDAKSEGLNRGFAFLDFSSRSDALDACKRLQRRDVAFGTDRSAKVAFADTFIEPDDEIMAQVKTIFVDGLPAFWDEDHVKDHLQRFGKIEKVELARNMPAARRRDFGFITFDTHENAMACVEGINNTEVGDGEKKVKIRARLSRPRRRGRSGKHARGGYSVGRSGVRSSRSSWCPGVSRMDSSRHAALSRRVIESHSSYRGAYKRPLGPRVRHPVAEMVPDRVRSRKRLPAMERSLDRRSPVLAYGKFSSKRDYVQSGEMLPRSSDLASRTAFDRRSNYRDDYALHGSEYLDSPPRAPRGAPHRPQPYEDDIYSHCFERPSYRDTHNRNYNSISAAKRPHSSVNVVDPRYVDALGRKTRTRYEYSGRTADLPYGDSDHYDHEPTRPGRGSHIGYEGSSCNSAGHSHRMYDSHASGMGYGQEGTRRGSGGGQRSAYGRDYVPSREDLGDGPYSSSVYSSCGLSDGCLTERNLGRYY